MPAWRNATAWHGGWPCLSSNVRGCVETESGSTRSPPGVQRPHHQLRQTAPGGGGNPGVWGMLEMGPESGPSMEGDPEEKHPDIPISLLNLAVSKHNRSSPSSVPAGPVEKDDVKKSPGRLCCKKRPDFPKRCQAKQFGLKKDKLRRALNVRKAPHISGVLTKGP